MSSKDVYLGLTFKDVFTKDYMVPKQWLMNGFGAGTDMKRFNTNWWAFKKQYRDRFMYNNLKKKIPTWITSTAQIMVIKEAALIGWLQSRYPGFQKYLTGSIGLPSIADVVQKFLYQTYGIMYKGNGKVVDDTDPNEVISYKVSKAGFVSLYGSSMPHNPNIVQGRTNVKKFSVTLTGSAVDSSGNPILDGSGAVKVYTKEHKNIDNTDLKESLIIHFMVNSIHVVEIHELSTVTAYYSQQNLEIVPSVPIQTIGRKPGAPNSDLRKWIEWFLEQRLGVPLRNKKAGEDGIWDILEKEDKDNDSHAHNKQIDYAFVVCGLQPKDPYILDVCGRVATEDVENIPLKVMARAKHFPTNVDPKYATHWDIACGPATKPGSKAWWAKRNKFRRKRFARLFYELLEYYGNGTTTVAMTGVPNTLEIVQSKSIVPGRFTNLYGRPAAELSHWFELVGTGPSAHIISRKQLDLHQYQEVKVTKITQELRIDGETFRLNMDGSWRSSADEENSGGPGELYPQLWVPWEMYDRCDFTSNIIIKEYGIKFMFFSKVVIKTNWIWTIVAIVVTIIVCVVPGLQAFCPGAIGWLTGTLSVSIVVAVVIYYAAVVLIQLALKEILSNIDNPWLKALVQIVVSVIMVMNGNFNEVLTNTSQMLMMAASVTTILYNAYYEIEMKKLSEDQARMDKNDAIQEQIETANQGSGLYKVSLQAHFSQNQANSPDAQTAQMESLTNYDQFYDVTGAINFRINVVPG